jgi:AbiV family abortive infection protein
MDCMGINLNKVDKMAGLSFGNGLRLHFDAILLFNNKSFPSAFFLSVLAIEEIGKSFLLMDFLYHSRSNGRLGEEHEREWLQLIYLHRAKQSRFAFNLGGPWGTTNSFFDSLYEGDQEILKQNSVYVGLEKSKGKINLTGKIKNPLKINEKKTQKQITRVNDCLLDLTLGVIKEIYFIDAYSVENLLNKKLFDKLNKSWPFIQGKTKERLAKIRKLE